jgi:hypothetical protein
VCSAAEVEPNDDGATATPVTPPALLRGEIGEPAADGTQDIDVYSFIAAAGTLYAVVVEGVEGPGATPSDYQAIFQVQGPGGYLRLGVDLDVTDAVRVARKQVFIPLDGTYFIIAFDQRLGDPTPVGGQDMYHYRLSINQVAVPAPTVAGALPYQTTSALEEGGIAFYQFSSNGGRTAIIEVTADRLTPASHMDSVVLLWDGANVLAIGDDFEAGSFDSRLTSVLPGTAADTVTLTVIVDYLPLVLPAGETLRLAYDLSIDVRGTVEIEPNQFVEQATPIVVGVDYTGNIDPQTVDAQGVAARDQDVYTVDLNQGDFVSIRVTPTAGSQVNPELWLVFPFIDETGAIDYGIRVVNDDSAGVASRIDVLIDNTLPWYLVVNDARNVIAGAAAPFQGGAPLTFGYVVRVDVLPFTPISVTPPATVDAVLDPAGVAQYVAVDAPGGGILSVEATNVGAGFAADTLTLVLREAADPGNIVAFAVAAPYVAEVAVAAATTYLAEVYHQNGEGGPAYTYTLSFTTRQVQQGDNCSDPFEVTMPVGERGAVTLQVDTRTGFADDYESTCPAAPPANGSDGFEVVYHFTLAAPARLQARLQGYDSILYVRTAPCDTGTVLACNDDDASVPGFGSLFTVTLPRGDFFLFADAWQNGGGGMGTLSLTFSNP